MTTTTSIVTKPNGHTNGHIPPVPVTDQVHGLLNDSIEQIAQGWIDQLEAVKADASALQNQVLASIADTKARLAAFHDLGAQVTAHAANSRQAIAKLSDGIAQIAGDAA